MKHGLKIMHDSVSDVKICWLVSSLQTRKQPLKMEILEFDDYNHLL